MFLVQKIFIELAICMRHWAGFWKQTRQISQSLRSNGREKQDFPIVLKRNSKPRCDKAALPLGLWLPLFCVHLLPPAQPLLPEVPTCFLPGVLLCGAGPGMLPWLAPRSLGLEVGVIKCFPSRSHFRIIADETANSVFPFSICLPVVLHGNVIIRNDGAASPDNLFLSVFSAMLGTCYQAGNPVSCLLGAPSTAPLPTQ